MATVKELKEHYHIGKYVKPSDGKGFLIYDKREGSGTRTIYKYLACLAKKGNSFGLVDNGKPIKYYSNIDKIIKDVNSYVKSLEFNSEYYDPSLRDGLFEELVIYDYLIGRGFKHDLALSNNDLFILNDKTVYGSPQKSVVLSINGLSPLGKNKLPEIITISLYNENNSFIKIECKREVYEIISKLDSLLKPYFLYESSKNLGHSDKYNFEQFDATINAIDYSTLNTLSKEYKIELKEKLKLMLDKLD